MTDAEINAAMVEAQRRAATAARNAEMLGQWPQINAGLFVVAALVAIIVAIFTLPSREDVLAEQEAAQRREVDLVRDCNAQGGTASVSRHGYFRSCTIPPKASR